MILKRQHFECIIPELNKKAFYDIIAGHDLFGYILIRRWGRIGTKGQPHMRQRFRNKKEMLGAFEKVHNE